MEIKALIKSNFISDLHYIALSFTIWIIALGTLHEPGEPLTFAQLLFIAIAEIGSLFILKFFEYENLLKVTPHRSDVLLYAASFIPGAFLGEALIRLLFPDWNFYLSQTVLLKTMTLAILFFGAYFASSYLLLKAERKRKILLDLTPRETSAFQEEMENLDISHLIDYLSHDDAEDYLQRGLLNKIDLIVISSEVSKEFGPDTLLLRAHLVGVPIIEIGQIIRMSGRIDLNETDLSTYLLEATQKTFIRRLLLRLRYSIEPFAAFFLAVLLSPLCILIALGLKVTSPGPILYKQTRTGYLGRDFTLYKFRSMRIDAERNGPQWSTRDDNRVTAFGAFLRRTRLDEIPQLWNVMRGEMSFIGPRPERPEIYTQLEKEVPLFRLRTLVPPGITGWAQVTAGYAASSEESLLKLEYDLFYIQHMSIRFDLYIFMLTLKTVFSGDRAARKQTLTSTAIAAQP